jgi:uncharacterized membrane protein YdfJ with MMPL/SSD domain
MNMNSNIDKLVDDALNSADGAARAAARPYLFTRLTARMQRSEDTYWEKAVRFITRPAVAIAGLCLVIAINVAAFVINDEDTGAGTDEQALTADDYSNSVATLYDIENNEP